MMPRLTNLFSRWSLVQRFTIASLVIVIFAMIGLGWWLAEQIRSSVIKESAVTAALYMDSFIAPNLQELSRVNILTAEHVTALNGILRGTDLGSRIVAFKVWDQQGNVLYKKGPSLFSDVFPNSADQKRVWQGEVVAGISNSQAEQKLEDQRFGTRLLQIYSPVRLSGTNQVIAIAEFYVKVDEMEAEIAAAQRYSWFVVGAILLIAYLLLVGFVKAAGNTIERQDTELNRQVARLTELLAQNAELHERVQRAAANTTALNERFLRRISAELHDGPTQELGMALLRLDRVVGQNEICRLSNPDVKCNEHLPVIQSALQSALQEMRNIAAGFGLPQLDHLTLADIFKRVVHAHEQRTGTHVALTVESLPEEAALPVKITTYRLIQEALTNAYRHAGGVGQGVNVSYAAGTLRIEVSDQGPGFDVTQPITWEEHLGLAGMRERVESLGGLFKVESKIGQGTKVTACLALQTAGGIADE